MMGTTFIDDIQLEDIEEVLSSFRDRTELPLGQWIRGVDDHSNEFNYKSQIIGTKIYLKVLTSINTFGRLRGCGRDAIRVYALSGRYSGFYPYINPKKHVGRTRVNRTKNWRDNLFKLLDHVLTLASHRITRESGGDPAKECLIPVRVHSSCLSDLRLCQKLKKHCGEGTNYFDMLHDDGRDNCDRAFTRNLSTNYIKRWINPNNPKWSQPLSLAQRNRVNSIIKSAEEHENRIKLIKMLK